MKRGCGILLLLRHSINCVIGLAIFYFKMGGVCTDHLLFSQAHDFKAFSWQPPVMIPVMVHGVLQCAEMKAQVESCCVYVKHKKIMQHMYGLVPYLFDCWADPVVNLLLLKRSTDGPIASCANQIWYLTKLLAY